MAEKPTPTSGLLGDLSTLETPESLGNTLEDLNRRGNAATAMMTVTRLEQWLKESLAYHFKNKPRRLLDKLFGFRDPLGNFSAKIDIAYAFGAISKEIYRTLHILRDIRNDFAHAEDELDFYSPVMDRHFAKLTAEENRELAFLESAVDCINDIKDKLNPLLIADVLRESSQGKQH